MYELEKDDYVVCIPSNQIQRVCLTRRVDFYNGKEIESWLLKILHGPIGVSTWFEYQFKDKDDAINQYRLAKSEMKHAERK